MQQQRYEESFKQNLILYKKNSCHLCENVELMLKNLGIEFLAVDIEENLELKKEYGLLIPVIFESDSKRELVYPFDEKRVLDFLEIIKKSSN